MNKITSKHKRKRLIWIWMLVICIVTPVLPVQQSIVQAASGMEWQTVGKKRFSPNQAHDTSIALDGSGTPYVAYQDHEYDRYATVMKFDGTNWVYVGSPGFSAGRAFDISIALDRNDTPYVAYSDNGHSGRATVMKFNGAIWEDVGSPGFSAGKAYDVSLALDSNGTPYVAYGDNGHSERATVMRFYEGDWEDVGSPGFSAGWAQYTSLALDSNNTPYVAYHAYIDINNSKKVTVMKLDGTDWVYVGSPGFSAGKAEYTSIALDSNDTPYVVYRDLGSSGKATMMRFYEGDWEFVGSPGFSENPSVSSSIQSAYYTSIALDSNDTPYVAYGDSYAVVASVMKFAPVPMYTASASADSATPGVGVDNEITLTVKNALGDTDTTFGGAHSVTVSVYSEAPDGSYGSFNGMDLTAGPNSVGVTFTSGVATVNLKLNKAEAQTIGFSVAGVATPDTNTVGITPVAGSAASMALTTDITAPTSNGGAFVQQPVVTLRDAYGNTSTGDSSTVVTVSQKDAGEWTLTGTTTATASAGVVTFSNLGATNVAGVNGAQLAFDASGFTQIASGTVTLPPAPAQTASASVASATPGVGVDNEITLTVKDGAGNTDTTFSGARNVSISGYAEAPNGSYGSFNGTDLTAGPNTISVTFTSGVATVNLKLNKAAAQTIGFSVAGVATPETNTVSITPIAGSAASMALTTDITAPTSNGGAFAQQPVVTLRDAYGNTSTGDSSTVVTVSKKDTGTWTLTGTLAATASSGVVSFTGLGATNTAAVTGAKLAFDAAGLTQIESSAVTLPKFQVSDPIITPGQPPITPEETPITPEETLVTPEPAVQVFHENVVDEAEFVQTLTSKAAEAKEVPETADFADTQGHWAEETIAIFVRLNIINGYKDGTFRPNNPITRAEFAAILNRVFPIQGGINTTTALKDIDGIWAQEAIENLVAAGVIAGYTDGTFRPNQTITREEMVVMLSRIVNLNGLEKDTMKGNFNDLGGSYATAEITAAAQAGIVSGKGNGSFEPKSNATRAEALQIILNVLKLNPQLKTLLESLS